MINSGNHENIRHYNFTLMLFVVLFIGIKSDYTPAVQSSPHPLLVASISHFPYLAGLAATRQSNSITTYHVKRSIYRAL